MPSIQIDVRDHAGRGLLVRRLRRPRRPRSRSARSSRSRRCRRGCSRRSAACSRSRSTCRARSRSSTGSSSTSTCRSTSSRARATLEHVRGDVRLERRLVPLRRGRRTRSTAIDIDDPGRARRRRSSARPAPGKTTLGYLVSRLYDADAGARHDRRRRRARADVRVARGHRRRRLAGDVPLPRDRAREPPLRASRTRPTRRSRRRRAQRRSTTLIASLPGGLRDRRRRARLPLLRRREAADRDRARDPAQPADPRARRGDLVARHADRARSCRRRWRGSSRGARRSRSPTGSRRSATPTRSSSSTRGASSRSARYDELVARGGRFAALAARDDWTRARAGRDRLSAPRLLAALRPWRRSSRSCRRPTVTLQFALPAGVRRDGRPGRCPSGSPRVKWATHCRARLSAADLAGHGRELRAADLRAEDALHLGLQLFASPISFGVALPDASAPGRAAARSQRREARRTHRAAPERSAS